jgi:hypothetical protein
MNYFYEMMLVVCGIAIGCGGLAVGDGRECLCGARSPAYCKSAVICGFFVNYN